MGGLLRTGIPAERIEAELRLQAVPTRRWREHHALVRAMEGAVLRVDREKQERQA